MGCDLQGSQLPAAVTAALDLLVMVHPFASQPYKAWCMRQERAMDAQCCSALCCAFWQRSTVDVTNCTHSCGMISHMLVQSRGAVLLQVVC